MIHEHLPLHPDEFYSVALPLEMALRNRLNPGFFNYPGMIIYANFAMYRLTGALQDVSLADRAGAELKSYAPFSLYFLSAPTPSLALCFSVACALRHRAIAVRGIRGDLAPGSWLPSRSRLSSTRTTSNRARWPAAG